MWRISAEFLRERISLSASHVGMVRWQIFLLAALFPASVWIAPGVLVDLEHDLTQALDERMRSSRHSREGPNLGFVDLPVVLNGRMNIGASKWSRTHLQYTSEKYGR